MAMNCKRYAPSHEVIYGFGRPHFWDDTMNNKMSVWDIFPKPQGLNHPCPYPLELISPLIFSSCPVGGIVLDPFLGSGTTALAAYNLDRKWVGIEKNEKYIIDAKNRINLEMKQQRFL